MKEVKKCIIEPYTPWQETTPGGIVTSAGNAAEFTTGGWRSKKPIWLQEKCKQCLLCWPTCPDVSIKVENQKMCGFDYTHCKGCGVCVEACPFDAIDFVEENEIDGSKINDVK